MFRYGYYGPFLLELSEIDPGCGVEDFNKVVYEYNFVTSLHQVYGSNPATSGLTSNNPDDRPEVMTLYFRIICFIDAKLQKVSFNNDATLENISFSNQTIF